MSINPMQCLAEHLTGARAKEHINMGVVTCK